MGGELSRIDENRPPRQSRKLSGVERWSTMSLLD
jgi:hypothetical protein